MTIDWIIFLGEQLLSMLIFSFIALITVWKRQKAFQQEIVLSQIENFPLERFKRFLSSRSRILRSYRQANTIVLLIIAVIIGIIVGLESINFTVTASFGEDIFFTSLNPMIAIIIGLLFGGYINDIFGAIIVDGEAMQFFQVGTLQRKDIQKQKLRTFLLAYIPILLILEFYSILIFTDINLFVWLAIFFALVIARLTLYAIFALPYHAFIKALQPIGKSEWALLEQRINAWANLLGIELAGIYIQKDLIGRINVYTLGLGKPHLLISEAFLHYSDWRQQDALICITLGLARKKVVQAKVILNAVMLFVTLGLILLLATFINDDLSDLITPLFLFVLLYILIRFGYTYAGRFIQKRYFAADRLAAFVTGDPVALMVALNTVNTFNNILPKQKTLNTPSTEARMRSLDALVRSSWPRAAQAGTPVPSIVTATFEQHYLTIPLDQASEASPVPASPFVPLQ